VFVLQISLSQIVACCYLLWKNLYWIPIIHRNKYQYLFKGPSIKDVRWKGGSVNQCGRPLTRRGGSATNRTSTIKCFGASESVSESKPPRPRATGLQYVLHFGGRFCAQYNPDDLGRGVSFKLTMWTGGGGGCPKSHFVPGRLRWMTPNDYLDQLLLSYQILNLKPLNYKYFI